MPKSLDTGVSSRVPVKLPSTKKTISQPPDWWAAFQAEADKYEMSLSAWIGMACFRQLPAAKIAKLSARPLASRPPKHG